MSKNKLAGIIAACTVAIIVPIIVLGVRPWESTPPAQTCTLTTRISPSEAGSVSPSSGEYESGVQVTLTASPASGYTFDEWSGSASGATPTITITMNSDKSITANFKGADNIPVPPYKAGTIVFALREIWTINPDGSSLKQLTNDASNKGSPRWSPDGKKIAFTSGRFMSETIFVMNSDGTNMAQLTDESVDAWNPKWSPDGKKIFFESWPREPAQYSALYVMEPDGSDRVKLTKDLQLEIEPSWSPYGTRIAYLEASEIYVMNVDGTNRQRLTQNSASEHFPSWSPDGTRIAFLSDRDGEFGLYVMNSHGSGQRKLAYVGDRSVLQLSTGSDVTCPLWSPDGKMIAYVALSETEPYYNEDVYVINADGTKQTRITYGEGYDYCGAWSPNGKQLAIVRGDADYDIYLIDTSVIEQLWYIQSESPQVSKEFAEGNMRRLFVSPGNGEYGRNVDWSPYLIDDE